jgi:hypothetical protein
MFRRRDIALSSMDDNAYSARCRPVSFMCFIASRFDATRIRDTRIPLQRLLSLSKSDLERLGDQHLWAWLHWPFPLTPSRFVGGRGAGRVLVLR